MTLSTSATIISVVVAFVFSALTYRVKSQARKDDLLRKSWRQKIEQIADDLSTDPEGLSFDEIMDLLDLSYWQDLYCELEKMPTGQRALQKAIEIIERDDYKRAPGKSL